MPEFAFISDVHSNLEALEVVLEQIQGMEIYCLGDVVGYGSNPNEVISLLRKHNVVSVLGNHDNAALTGDTGHFNARAEIALLWTKRHLTAASVDFLTGLPRSRRVDLRGLSAFMTHGSPDDNLWEYVDPATHGDLFDHYLVKLSVKGLALGHTHVPYVWAGGMGKVFNPGSVGQPRDGDRRAAYATADVSSGEIVVKENRVEYDIQKASAKIVEAGLPMELAARLALGR